MYISCTNTHLRRLTRAIVGIAPQDDLPDLVQNAVSLFEIPLPLFASLVRQVSPQEVKKLNSLVLQLGELILWYTGLASGDIPFHALARNEDIHHVCTWIRNMLQAAQTGACFGVVDCSVDKLNLVYKSIYHDVTGI